MGYGLVEEDPDGVAFAVVWGVLAAKPRLPLGERLHRLYGELLKLMELYTPDEVAAEEPFVSRNARTAMAIGQAQGVALMAAAAQGVQAVRYSPLQVKHAVTGYGGASKEQVQQAVLMHLGLKDPSVPEDASDALAVALCHLRAGRATMLLAQEP